MGTRSLLAYETKTGHYQVQYMQFDGCPEVKGKEYYNAILRGLEAGRNSFVTDGRPNEDFFKMVRHFLEHYQYESAHSIRNAFRSTPMHWLDTQANEEFKYLVNRRGDFIFCNTSNDAWTYVIPWEFTWALVKTDLSRTVRGVHGTEDEILAPALWVHLEENQGPTILDLEFGEVKAFDSTPGDDGYRSYAVLRKNEQLLKASLFMQDEKPGLQLRNIRHVCTIFFPFRGVSQLFEQVQVSDWPGFANYLGDLENLPGIDPSLDTWVKEKVECSHSS